MPVSPAPASVTLRYKKVVGLGLTFQAINFAQGEFMGHRVRLSVPVDYMNQYFFWERAAGDYRPTGRFADAGRELAEPQVADLPSFANLLEWALGTRYTDIDGVADALNYSSDALDTYNDSKRDDCVLNFASAKDLAADPTAATASPATHYGANDLVMAYVLNKCFGSSAFDAEDIIYNLEDAFGMLSSKALAEAVRDSFVAEDTLATGVLAATAEPKPGQRGKVDEMFRALLAADPKRFFLNGKQIEGLFETNYVCPDASGDIAAAGNWCLKAGDILEVPIKLVFTAPVTVLSVVDNAKEPSSLSPEKPETVFIKGEEGADAQTAWVYNAENLAAANRANIMSIRLQLACDKPLDADGRTFATSEVNDASGALVALPLKITNQMNLVFYNSPYYPKQSAIAIMAAGGVVGTAYAYAVNATSELPRSVTLDEVSGILTFNRLDDAGVPLAGADAPVAGRFQVSIDVTCDAETVTADIFVSIDNGTGSSNVVA
jgi:hypothetical protein